MLAIGITAGLIFTFSVGIGDFFQSIIARKIGRYKTLFIRHLITLILLLPFLIYFYLNGLISVTITNLIWLVAGTLFYFFGYANFLKAFEIGNVSIVSPISSACSIVTIILSAIFLGEILKPMSYLSILIIIGGIVLTSTDIKQIKNIKSVKGLKESFIAMIMFGIYFFALGKAGKSMNTLSLFMYAMTIQSFIFIICTYFKTKTIAKYDYRGNLGLFFAITVVLYILAWIGFNYGAAKGMVSIVTPISSLYPVITVILATAFYDERLVLNQKAGIALVIAGLFMLNIV
jgi:drug/metabolite transporter (DMT)-like permease